MECLLVKDIRLLLKQKNYILIVILMSLVLGMMFNNMNFMNSYLTFFSSIYVLGTLNYDEFDNGMAYLMCLPLCKKDYIKGKYILMIGVAFIMSILGTIFNIGYSFINHIPFNVLEILAVIFTSVILALLMIDVMLPIELKYGKEKGRIAIMIAYGLLFLITYMLFSFINSYNPSLINNALNFIESSPVIVLMICIIFIVMITFISFKISFKILNNKEF